MSLSEVKGFVSGIGAVAGAPARVGFCGACAANPTVMSAAEHQNQITWRIRAPSLPVVEGFGVCHNSPTIDARYAGADRGDGRALDGYAGEFLELPSAVAQLLRRYAE